MLLVVLALMPGTVVYALLFGWGVITNIVLAIIAAVSFEMLALWFRGRSVKLFISDFSVVVTALLLALALPPLSPWWLVLVGVFFAVIFGKQLYGGLGYNPFNPAMVGYVALLIAFPQVMTNWVAPISLSPHSLSFVESWQWVLGETNLKSMVDAMTMATPLDTVKTQLGLDKVTREIMAGPVFGHVGGQGLEWINACFLMGGCWLLYKKVISWHIPLAMLGTLCVIAMIFNLMNPDQYAGPLFHLFTGAMMLGAFFIATDPVSACTTVKGRIIFGAGIAVIAYVIRNWGGYPDGIAFAVLLMNMAAPMIDHYSRPKVFGEAGRT